MFRPFTLPPAAWRGRVPVIPGRRNRKRAVLYDKQGYRDRNLV